MASSGPTAGLKAEVDVSNAASTDFTSATYVDVERVNSPGFTGTQKKADASSNDSGGNEEHVVTWRSGKFSFEMIADGAAATAGQAHLWTMFAAGEIRAFRYRPTGDVSGDTQYRFLASIDDIEDMGPKEGGRSYKVTVTRTGSHTRDTQ